MLFYSIIFRITSARTGRSLLSHREQVRGLRRLYSSQMSCTLQPTGGYQVSHHSDATYDTTAEIGRLQESLCHATVRASQRKPTRQLSITMKTLPDFGRRHTRCLHRASDLGPPEGAMRAQKAIELVYKSELLCDPLVVSLLRF